MEPFELITNDADDDDDADDYHQQQQQQHCSVITSTSSTAPLFPSVAASVARQQYSNTNTNTNFNLDSMNALILPVLVVTILVSGTVLYHRKRQRPYRYYRSSAFDTSSSSPPLPPPLPPPLTRTTNPSTALPYNNSNNNSNSNNVPIIVYNDPDWNSLDRAVKGYRDESQAALQALSATLERVLAAEHDRPHLDRTNNSNAKLSKHIEQRIRRLAAVYEQDANTLQTILLVPFCVTKVLLAPPPPTIAAAATQSHRSSAFPLSLGLARVGTNPVETNDNNDNDNETNNDDASALQCPLLSVVRSKRTAAAQSWATNNNNNNSDNDINNNTTTGSASYETACQILAHLARDWSAAGAAVRQTLYPWCLERLAHYVPPDHSCCNKSVLVPGAGLGRLAWELAVAGPWNVHALEASVVMVAAASRMLRNNNNNSDNNNSTSSLSMIHPYAMDHFVNEVDAANRYESVMIPDVNVSQQPLAGSLSFTVGLFGTNNHRPQQQQEQQQQQQQQQYAAIVTCFFLDTATNVYEYLDAMYESVEPSGVWINVGPLQWHGNAEISMAANELHLVLHDYGWRILEWSVDVQPTPYRGGDIPTAAAATSEPRAQQHPRSTHYDAYRPLRFVVQKK